MEHQGHWLCKIHDASEELYEACKAVEHAFDQKRDFAIALKKVREAIQKAEENRRPKSWSSEVWSHEI